MEALLWRQAVRRLQAIAEPSCPLAPLLLQGMAHLPLDLGPNIDPTPEPTGEWAWGAGLGVWLHSYGLLFFAFCACCAAPPFPAPA